jgi:hypothetical protein
MTLYSDYLMGLNLSEKFSYSVREKKIFYRRDAEGRRGRRDKKKS